MWHLPGAQQVVHGYFWRKVPAAAPTTSWQSSSTMGQHNEMHMTFEVIAHACILVAVSPAF